MWLSLTVLSVMNGFERTRREEIIGNRSHFTVHHSLGPVADYEEVIERVTAMPGVVSAAPYLDAEGMVPRLREMLMKRHPFSRQRELEEAACAVAGLRGAGTAAALSVLREAAADKKGELRTMVERASLGVEAGSA